MNRWSSKDFLKWLLNKDGIFCLLGIIMIYLGFGGKVGMGIIGAIMYFKILDGNN